MTDDGFVVSDMSLHEAMRQQVLDILDDSDLTEEQKQEILVSMSCACCGGGGMSLTIPLKGGKPGF